MKTAKVLVQSIELACPHCKQVISPENNGKGLLRKDEIADRWETLREKRWTCPICQRSFHLPANPFGEDEAERAADTARRRSQGAKDGWEIRCGKQQGGEP